MKLILCSNLNSVINNVLARWAGLFKLCACVAQAMVHVSARHEQSLGLARSLAALTKGIKSTMVRLVSSKVVINSVFIDILNFQIVESRIIIINPIRYDMIFPYFIGIADGSKILPESFAASQQVILQTLTSIQLPLFFRFPDVRREQLPSICIVQSPPPIYTILSAASALLIHQYSCAICVS